MVSVVDLEMDVDRLEAWSQVILPGGFPPLGQ